MIRLVDVYDNGLAPASIASFLYQLLSERTAAESISHRAMPRYEEHLAFLASRPYREWWLIEARGALAGMIYLTYRDEIGIAVARAHRANGFGTRALAAMIARHPDRRLYANVNPSNDRSRKLFEKLGFSVVQLTLSIEPHEPLPPADR